MSVPSRLEDEAVAVLTARWDTEGFDGFRAAHPWLTMDAALDIWVVAKTTRERTAR